MHQNSKVSCEFWHFNVFCLLFVVEIHMEVSQTQIACGINLFNFSAAFGRCHPGLCSKTSGRAKSIFGGRKCGHFSQWLRHEVLLQELTDFQARNCLLSCYEFISQHVTIFSYISYIFRLGSFRFVNLCGLPFFQFLSFSFSESQERGSVAAMDSDVALCISLSTSAISTFLSLEFRALNTWNSLL